MNNNSEYALKELVSFFHFIHDNLNWLILFFNFNIFLCASDILMN